jgi:hypothetical protein
VADDLDVFLTRLNERTSREAGRKYEKGKRFSWPRLLFWPLVVFGKTYFLKKNVFQGSRGMVISCFAAYEAFLIEGKLWELEAEPGRVYERLKEFEE